MSQIAPGWLFVNVPSLILFKSSHLRAFSLPVSLIPRVSVVSTSIKSIFISSSFFASCSAIGDFGAFVRNLLFTSHVCTSRYTYFHAT
ncbi:hypothetical protein HanIR_Chr04g0201991 [Helianthus annuus]|nr:hypothetical protein HanIR_Chr04g0201991 [Helianthus annuus]